MIGKNHVQIDGEKYLLAQDADGIHYDLAGEPLRPPNALGVAGDQGKFQVRPDLLLWKLTDWSGGEGRIKYSAETQAQHFEITNLDPFDEPGKLKMGPSFNLTTFAGVGFGFNHACTLVRAMGSIWAVSMNDNKVYGWNVAGYWDAADTNAGQVVGAGYGVHGDGSALYYIERGQGDIWEFDGTTFTLLSTGTLTVYANGLAGLGPYLYTHDWKTGQVWETLKSTGVTTSIDEPNYLAQFTGSAVTAPRPQIVAGDNRVYTGTVVSGDTYIREITPTSAAGAGFGAKIAHLNGFEVEAMWWFNSTLFLLGSSAQAAQDKTVLYIRPGESFGSIGRVRNGVNMGTIGSAGENNGSMLLHGFVTQNNGAASETTARYTGVWVIDAVSGGMCLLCSTEDGTYDDFPLGPVYYDNRWWWSSDASANKKVFVTGEADYNTSGFFTSPLHDFDLADEKVLSSIRVVLEDDMPTDWEIKVYYGLDTATPDTLALTMDDTDGNSLATAITTAAVPVVFDHLSIRVEFEYTGAGNPGTTPVLLQVEVRAQLSEKPKRWRLLLDCADRKSGAGGPRGYNGATKLSKLKLAIAKSVVSFVDGYESKLPSVSNTYDVVIDNYREILSKPGEGVVYVELVEVL